MMAFLPWRSTGSAGRSNIEGRPLSAVQNSGESANEYEFYVVLIEKSKPCLKTNCHHLVNGTGG